jgi:MFS family permease
MFQCDLCEKPTEGSALVGISAKHMHKAVREAFNPFDTPGIEMPESVAPDEEHESDDEDRYEEWRQRVLGANVDWRLCPACMGALFEATASDQKVKAESGEGQPNQVKLFVGPLGALIAIVSFFFPWVTHSLTYDEYYFWDQGLGGVLWVAFAAALVTLLFSIYGMLGRRSDNLRTFGVIWVVGLWIIVFLGLALTGVLTLTDTLVYRWGWEMLLGLLLLAVFLLISILLVKRARSEGGDALMPKRLAALSAILGLVMIVVKLIQVANGPYDFAGSDLYYDQLKGIADVTILYGAWGVLAGFVLAFVGSFLLKSDEESEGYKRPLRR